jgi:hypothetical protein
MHPLRALREAGKNSAAELAEVLAEDVVFHSPVFIKPVVGRDAVAYVFAASARLTGSYVSEHVLDDRTRFIHWAGAVDGHAMEILEVVTDDAAGLVKERRVAFRPFPAIAVFRDLVYPSLKDRFGPEYWDYPADAGAEAEPSGV